ncbi:hypothetical protein T439DRAFT_322502 [Meredithblackwellia eburnea MCA 4105]
MALQGSWRRSWLVSRLFPLLLIATLSILPFVSDRFGGVRHRSTVEQASRARTTAQQDYISRSCAAPAAVCSSLPPPTFHPNPSRRTVLASYPRSGNSLLRSLVQRATGYVSGSMYCDQELVKALVGECNNTDFFFYKSHFPSGALWGAQIQQNPNYWRSFDQVVYLERNPLDAFYSDWHRIHTDGSMTARAKIGLLGDEEEHWQDIASMVFIYRAHHQYWDSVPIPKLHVQYETLRSVHLRPILDHLSSFLLSDDEPVDEDRLDCALQDDPSKEVYKSRKHLTFHSWERWTPALRNKVLVSLLPTLCRSGYLSKMKTAIPDDTFLHSLECPLLQREAEMDILMREAVDFNGNRNKISMRPTTSQASDFAEIARHCPSFAISNTKLASDHEEWYRILINRRACDPDDQDGLAKLLQSAVLQCFSWCIFDLGDPVMSDAPDKAMLMTRLSPKYDDGSRKGWAIRGECWYPFDETHKSCPAEWPWVSERLGLPVAVTPV